LQHERQKHCLHIVMTRTLVVMLGHVLNVLHFVGSLICLIHIGDMYPFRNISSTIVNRTHLPNGLWYMTHNMQLRLSKMFYMVLDGFLELLKTHFFPSGFKLNQVEIEFLHIVHLFLECDTINVSLQQRHYTVCISNTPGGGLSFSIRWMDLKFCVPVGGVVCCSVYLFLRSSPHMTL